MTNPNQPWDTAENEYTGFQGTEVRTERRRIWVGPPHFRYVWRNVVVNDLGRPASVEPSKKSYIRPFRESERNRKHGTNRDRAERWLQDNGPHTLIEISAATGIPESSLRYTCRVSPRIIKNIDTGKWGVI
jgi:hypothetical protein